MRKLIINVLAFLLPLSAICQTDRINQKVSSLLKAPADYGIGDVPPDIREEVILRIRESVGGETFAQTSGNEREKYLLLVRLGEVDATQQVVEAMQNSLQTPEHGWPLQDFLFLHAQPSVIPMISKDFFLDDGDTITLVQGTDTGYAIGPLSVEMCRLAFNVILQNDAFLHTTRVWASDVLERMDYSPPHDTRDLMQQWWRANEAHFKSLDYRAVRPGAKLPERPGPFP